MASAVSLVVVFLLVALEPARAAPLFPAMFVFGDSLADTGNNNYFLTLARANMLPNGIDFPLGPTGRFCNGETVIDVLCELIGLPFLPPSLAPATVGNKLLFGVNYASAANGILSTSGMNYLENMSLAKQLHQFNGTIHQIAKQLGSHRRASSLISRSLFIFVIGGNDYINNYYLNRTMQTLYTKKAFQSLLISSLTRDIQVSGLWAAYLPSSARTAPMVAVFESINRTVKRYSAAFKNRIHELNFRLSGAAFIYLNAFDGLHDMIVDPLQYGFNVTNRGCCGAGKFNGQVPCFPVISKVCSSRKSYVFWDAFHPTAAVNRILGPKIFNGTKRYASPMNVVQLASKL